MSTEREGSQGTRTGPSQYGTVDSHSEVPEEPREEDSLLSVNKRLCPTPQVLGPRLVQPDFESLSHSTRVRRRPAETDATVAVSSYNSSQGQEQDPTVVILSGSLRHEDSTDRDDGGGETERTPLVGPSRDASASAGVWSRIDRRRRILLIFLCIAASLAAISFSILAPFFPGEVRYILILNSLTSFLSGIQSYLFPNFSHCYNSIFS